MQRTPTTLQSRLAAQVAAGHTTTVWQVPGELLWLIALSEAAIRRQSSPPLFFAVLCMWAVCRACAAKNKNTYDTDLW